MKIKIIWSEDAANELAEIILYIKKNSNKITAKNFHEKIMSKVRDASENIKGRKTAPLLKEFGIIDVYQININPWAIYYKAENNFMKLIAIIDLRRNSEEILYQKIMEEKIK